MWFLGKVAKMQGHDYPDPGSWTLLKSPSPLPQLLRTKYSCTLLLSFFPLHSLLCLRGGCCPATSEEITWLFKVPSSWGHPEVLGGHWVATGQWLPNCWCIRVKVISRPGLWLLELEPLAWAGWDGTALQRDRREHGGSGESHDWGYSNRCPEKGAEPSR